MKPFIVKKGTPEQTLAMCGKCPNCRKKRVSTWSFRLLQEFKVSDSAYFVTLTYNTENIPFTKTGLATLSKSDAQKFMKRLRHYHKQSRSLKYYLVGEYGGTSERPHYHIILFNAQPELIEKAWSLDDQPIGHIHLGDVNGATVGYTMKYISKPPQIPMFKTDDRVKEFSLMSKGLGKSYLCPSNVKWHKADTLDRMHLNIEGNKKIAMPRYYKEKLYTEQERKAISQALQDKLISDLLRDIMSMTMDEQLTKRWNKKQSIEQAYRKQKTKSLKTKI